MKNSKIILVTTLASLFAVLTVVNMSLANPKSADDNTLDMLEIMTRAFDESEGGEGGTCPTYTWDELLPDVQSNMCLGGSYPCWIVWYKDGIPIAVYLYNSLPLSENEDMVLVCGEA